jgi:hypothetical protein
MRALNKSVLVLLLASLAGCGQQLLEFADANPSGPGGPVVPGTPSITSTDPLNTATSVVVSTTVNATFSEVMTAGTLNSTTFTLKQGTTPILGIVTYAGSTATFTPSAPLSSNLFTATVTTGAQSAATGNGMTTNYTWTFSTLVPPPPPPLAINLGKAVTFGLASRAGLTSTGVTVVNGDVALYPLASCIDSTGNAGAGQTCLVKTYSSPTGMTVRNSIFWAGDPFDNGATANSVTTDLNTAWVEGKNKVPTKPAILGDQMAGKTFLAGVYRNATLGLSAGGTATLDAQNDANAIFVFQVDSSFVDSGTALLKSKIALINGAQARNVWFVVGLDLTIGHGTIWNGNVLAGRDVTILDGSAALGRVLAGASGAGALTLTGAASPSVTSVTVPP